MNQDLKPEGRCFKICGAAEVSSIEGRSLPILQPNRTVKIHSRATKIYLNSLRLKTRLPMFWNFRFRICGATRVQQKAQFAHRTLKIHPRAQGKHFRNFLVEGNSNTIFFKILYRRYQFGAESPCLNSHKLLLLLGAKVPTSYCSY